MNKEIVYLLICFILLYFVYSQYKEPFTIEPPSGAPSFSEIQARYIIITLPYKPISQEGYLHISELEVYDSSNIKLTVTPVSSTVLGNDSKYNAQKSIDNNISTFVHTEDEKPWLLYDLGDDKKINRVVVKNRMDAVKERIVNANLILLNKAQGDLQTIINRLNSERDINTNYVYKTGFSGVQDVYTFNVNDWTKPIQKIDCVVEEWRQEVLDYDDINWEWCENYGGIYCNPRIVDNAGWGSCVPEDTARPWWGGTQYRSRNIITPASGGGNCNVELSQSRFCRP